MSRLCARWGQPVICARHPDFLPRRGENLPCLPGKTTNGDNLLQAIEKSLNKPCSTHVQTKTLLSGKVLFFSAKLPPDNNRCIGTPPWHYTIRKLKGEQKNSANYTQTLHDFLYSSDYSCVTKCIVCASNYTQTIHKTLH